MTQTQAEWDKRVRIGLLLFEASAELRAVVNGKVEAFFARNAALQRTRDAEVYVASLFYEQMAEEAAGKTTNNMEEKAA